ncbi:MAG: excisionase family DNA-binding protein [Deltaproteobacteria bacterium]|nr:excisionase family DNA-binding protein [Deltaproteobacteria bacterium]
MMSLPLSSVYLLIAEGKLPSVRIGRRSIRVPKAAIDALVARAMSPIEGSI